MDCINQKSQKAVITPENAASNRNRTAQATLSAFADKTRSASSSSAADDYPVEIPIGIWR
eukprot:scaffold531777_cov42-Prasinocladus_malaysianus.AAC.1